MSEPNLIPTPTFLIGADGGGSGCRVAIADASGAILATAAGGPANASTDRKQAVASLLSALDAAAATAGLTAAAIAGATAHLGLAGVLTAEDAAAIASRMPFPACTVTDDRPTSLAGALGGRDGVLIAVGTGTFLAAQRGPDRRFIGGWGLTLGDQASGAWLGRALLQEVLLSVDGLRDHSALTRATLAAFGDDPSGLVRFAAAAQPSNYAGHAPGIVAAAAEGDPMATELMQRGAGYLHAALAVLAVGPTDVLCLSGGLGPHYAEYLDPCYRALLSPPRGTALDGALRLAGMARRAEGAA
jgi:glucosamine kinase